MYEEKPRKPQRSDFVTRGTYQDALIDWRNGQRQARKQARAAASVTFGLMGAVYGSSLAGSGLPGGEMDAYEAIRGIADTQAQQEQRRRSNDIELGTIDHGYSSRYNVITHMETFKKILGSIFIIIGLVLIAFSIFRLFNAQWMYFGSLCFGVFLIFAGRSLQVGDSLQEIIHDMLRI